MKLPADAIIPRPKLTEYLLVPQVKGDKSAWLLKAGYHLGNVETLEGDIREHLLPHPAVLTRRNQFGEFYAIDGEVVGPNGTLLRVRSIWVRRRLPDRFSFVTLYPRRR